MESMNIFVGTAIHSLAISVSDRFILFCFKYNSHEAYSVAVANAINKNSFLCLNSFEFGLWLCVSSVHYRIFKIMIIDDKYVLFGSHKKWLSVYEKTNRYKQFSFGMEVVQYWFHIFCEHLKSKKHLPSNR